MAESRDAFNELDQIRREAKKLNRNVDNLNQRVDTIHDDVERARITQLAVLSTAHATPGEGPPELVLHSAEMSIADIAAALGKKPDAVRKAIQRARARLRKRK